MLLPNVISDLQRVATLYLFCRKARPVAPSVNPSGGKTAATAHLKRKKRPDYLTADLVPTHSTLVISPLRSKPHYQRAPAIHCARLRRGLPL